MIPNFRRLAADVAVAALAVVVFPLAFIFGAVGLLLGITAAAKHFRDGEDAGARALARLTDASRFFDRGDR